MPALIGRRCTRTAVSRRPDRKGSVPFDFHQWALLNSIYSRPGADLGSIITAPSRASIGDRETGRTPARSEAGGAFMGSKKLSPEQKWHEQAEAFKREAEKLPYGRQREDLLRKASQLETASHINEWVSSPGLEPPR